MSDVMEVARENVEVFSHGDWDRYRKLLATGTVYEEFATGRRVEGADAVIETARGWKQAFPDATGSIINALASGNTAVLEITWQGTQTGR
jgi:hypothetical protein